MDGYLPLEEALSQANKKLSNTWSLNHFLVNLVEMNIPLHCRVSELPLHDLSYFLVGGLKNDGYTRYRKIRAIEGRITDKYICCHADWWNSRECCYRTDEYIRCYTGYFNLSATGEGERCIASLIDGEQNKFITTAFVEDEKGEQGELGDTMIIVDIEQMLQDLSKIDVCGWDAEFKQCFELEDLAKNGVLQENNIPVMQGKYYPKVEQLYITPEKLNVFYLSASGIAEYGWTNRGKGKRTKPVPVNKRPMIDSFREWIKKQNVKSYPWKKGVHHKMTMQAVWNALVEHDPDNFEPSKTKVNSKSPEGEFFAYSSIEALISFSSRGGR